MLLIESKSDKSWPGCEEVLFKASVGQKMTILQLTVECEDVTYSQLPRKPVAFDMCYQKSQKSTGVLEYFFLLGSFCHFNP